MASSHDGVLANPASQLQTSYPTSNADDLRARYVGKSLQTLDGPQAVLDLAVIRKNCRLMLETVDALNTKFRAHVKTTKTVEITKLQVGDAPRDVNLIVSTVTEAEFLLEYLLDCKQKGRKVNVLYGIPPSSSCFRRLDELRLLLGPSSISYLTDHPSQLHHLAQCLKVPDVEPIPVFVKVDTGYHRAGVGTDTAAFDEILEAFREPDVHARFRLYGFYSHNSQSYSVDSPDGALGYLESELEGVIAAAEKASSKGFEARRLTLSVGATPSASSAQNLVVKNSSDPTVKRLQDLIKSTQDKHDVELHAGVYTVLDLQQVATHARPLESTDTPTMTTKDIGIRILAEVLSVYPAGSRSDKPEALVGAGTLAMGREPCKMYDGWGIVAPNPWYTEGPEQIYEEKNKTGWTIGRISQEHGVLTWQGGQERVRQLVVYQKVLIWPNHACIAAAGFGWFIIVDSEVEQGTKIVDVWVKCRGW